MSLTLKQLDQQLSSGKVDSLYFIMGPELFLVKEALRLLRSCVFTEVEDREFNDETLTGGITSASKLRVAVETAPVFCNKRLVVYEKAHLLTESDGKIIEPIITKPVTTCVLVFVCSEGDKRKKMIKRLMSACTVISAQTPKESQWRTWIEWMGKKNNLALSPLVVDLLQQQVACNLMSLQSEIQKIKSFVGDKKQVSVEDVLNVISRVRPENIFALSRAIGKRKVHSALLCWSKLLEDNQNEIGALALIVRHIRILARIKAGQKKACSRQELCGLAGVPSFTIQDYMKEADLWTEQSIMSTLQVLSDTDRALKSFSIPPAILLENCIIKACHLA